MTKNARPQRAALQVPDFGGSLSWQDWMRWSWMGDIPESERTQDLNYGAVCKAVESECRRLEVEQGKVRAQAQRRALELLGIAPALVKSSRETVAWRAVLQAHAHRLRGPVSEDVAVEHSSFWAEQRPVRLEDFLQLGHGLPPAAQSRIFRCLHAVNRAAARSGDRGLVQSDLSTVMGAFLRHVRDQTSRHTVRVIGFNGVEHDQLVYLDGQTGEPAYLGGQRAVFVSPGLDAALVRLEFELREISHFEAADHVSEDVVSAVQKHHRKEPPSKRFRPEDIERCLHRVVRAQGQPRLATLDLDAVYTEVIEEWKRDAVLRRSVPGVSIVRKTVRPLLTWHPKVKKKVEMAGS